MQRIVRSGVCRVGRVGFGREGRVCGDARIKGEMEGKGTTIMGVTGI